MCAQSQNNICEVYDDTGILAAMLLDRANGLEKGKGLYVQHAAENTIATPVGQMIYSTAGEVSSRPAGLFVVINADKMLDELGLRYSDASTSDKEAIARQIINFGPLPEKMQGVQPLCAWIPGADGI